VVADQSQPQPLNVRFSVFEMNFVRRELLKGGTHVKIQKQPFEILCMLLERPGKVVSREELRERLWPEHTFVEYEDSLNTAVRKLRVALSDSSDLPRYVETVAHQGYRFIAPVVEVDRESAGAPLVRGLKESRERLRSTRPQVAIETPSSQSNRRVLILASLLIAFAAASLLPYWRAHSRRSGAARRSPDTVAATSRLTDKDTVVLSDFANKTDDPVFDETLKQGLLMELTQSPFLTVASDLQVDEILRRMGRTPRDLLTRELASEACLRMGGKAILAGSISAFGTHYILGLEALGCSNGETLAVGQAEAENKEGVLKALGRVASLVRVKVGESLPSLEKYDFPVNATTNSLEALKAFSMGLKAERNAGVTASIPFYQHAIRLDHKFALAYAVLGRAYEDFGEDSKAMHNFDRAFQLKNRLSEREKYFLTTLYNETVTGDLEKAKEAGELWTATYPRDGYAREKLATVYADLGAMQEAYDQARQALQLNPESGVNVFNMVEAAISFNRLDEAVRVLQTAESQGLDGEEIHESSYQLAFQRSDTAEMERQVRWGIGKPGVEEYLLTLHLQTQAYLGRMRTARELSDQVTEWAKRGKATEIAANVQIMAALQEAEVGHASLAGQHVRSALSLAPTRNIKLQAALALARSGHANSARALLKELETRNPANTLVKFYWGPAIKASLDIQAGMPEAAVSQLGIVVPYELSQADTVNASLYMYPTYIRGQAYMATHNGSAASAEFRKVLEHRGVVQNGLLGALSRLQLARAEVMMGDIVGARQQYQDFFSLWKDADNDIPILRQARAERAKLQ